MVQPAYTSLRIKELPKSERPRERLQQRGARALSDAELLAIALRTGTRHESALDLARRLQNQFGGLYALARTSIQEICQVPGIGPAKASQIQAALELGRRLVLAGDGSRMQIRDATDASILLMAEIGAEPQEHLCVILLDTKHYVQRIVRLYEGNVNSSFIRPAEVFRDAVKDNATAIILGHNHPSGDPTASPDDIAVTRTLIQAGELLEIHVLDHLIVGRGRYVSLKAEGLAFT
ncbi:MAG: DNA repair protein RadC [Anaerolineae bacterium]|nr:DNA repair protein RadC [Anaerolineae bacterium]